MRILYFSFVELDIPNACRTHTLGVLNGFSHHGCRVDAVIPRPIGEPPRIPNVRVHYLRRWQHEGLGFLWAKSLSCLIMFCLCMKNRYDFFYVRELELHLWPRVVSRLFGIPLYIEINELVVPFFAEKGSGPAFLSRLKKSQKKDFGQAARLIVPSVPMRDWLIRTYRLPPSKVHLVLNGAEPPVGKMLSAAEARRKLGIPADCYCLGFLGTLYDRYDFETLFKAMIKCRQSIANIFLLVIGDGPLKQSLSARSKELDLQSQVMFTGYIKPGELGGYMPAMDLGMLIINRAVALRYGPVNTKFSTYGIFGIPVISSGISLAGYPSQLQQTLYLTPPEDPQALADLITSLYRNPASRRATSKMIYDFVRHNMTWNNTAAQILSIHYQREK